MKLRNLLSKYQKYLLVIAIVLSSLAISIRGNEDEVTLTLQDYPIAIFLMIVVSSLLVMLYIQIGKRNIATLSDQIKEQSKVKDEDFNSLLIGLTSRQKESFYAS